MTLRLLSLVIALAVLLSGPAPALADVNSPGALEIGYVSGDVGVQRADDNAPIAAVRNAPLLPGDSLSTAAGRAELHLAPGIRLRIDADTQVRVARADADGSEIQLGQGTVELRVFQGGNVQVDTPTVALSATEPGAYAASVASDGTVTLMAYSGNATVDAQTGNQPLAQGSAVQVTGTADAPSIQTGDAAPLDPDFADFNHSRDAAEARAFQRRVAAARMDGAEDLDGYGRWVSTPDGPAWIPTEAPGWSPYSDGSFVYEPYYGYTWVGAEPWGWAPYHYGRWAFDDGLGWVWVPGPPSPWSPALVAFVQTAAAIAWLPLGPRDPFLPWWGTHPVTVFVANINVYRNARFEHAFVRMPIDRFRAGDFRHVDRVAYGSLGRVRVVNVTRAFAPTRANLAFTSARPKRPLPGFTVRTTFAGNPVAFVRPAFNGRPVTALSRPVPVSRLGFGAPASVNQPQRPVSVQPPAAGRPAFGPTAVTRPGFGPARSSTATVPTTATRPAFGPTAVTRPAFGPSGASTATAPTAATRPAFGPAPVSRPAFGPAPVSRPAFGPAAVSRPAFGPSGASTATAPTAVTRPAFGPTAVSRPAFGPAPVSRPAYAPSTATRSTFGPSSTGTYGAAPAAATRSYGSAPAAPVTRTYGSAPSAPTTRTYGSSTSTTTYGSTARTPTYGTYGSQQNAAPAYQRPAPAYQAPAAPVYQRPAPVYQAPAATTRTAPTYVRPTPRPVRE